MSGTVSSGGNKLKSLDVEASPVIAKKYIVLNTQFYLVVIMDCGHLFNTFMYFLTKIHFIKIKKITYCYYDNEGTTTYLFLGGHCLSHNKMVNHGLTCSIPQVVPFLVHQ